MPTTPTADCDCPLFALCGRACQIPSPTLGHDNSTQGMPYDRVSYLAIDKLPPWSLVKSCFACMNVLQDRLQPPTSPPRVPPPSPSLLCSTREMLMHPASRCLGTVRASVNTFSQIPFEGSLLYHFLSTLDYISSYVLPIYEVPLLLSVSQLAPSENPSQSGTRLMLREELHRNIITLLVPSLP
jgi:hypothetical protein